MNTSTILGLPERKVYDYDVAWAAMCIIEEIVEPNLAGEPWKPLRDRWGICGVRDAVLDKLAGPCNTAWDRAQEEFNRAYDVYINHQIACAHADTPFHANPPDEPGSFDYEFVPFWLRSCVDWSDLEGGPRVKGTGAS